jgi:hypothetical protein
MNFKELALLDGLPDIVDESHVPKGTPSPREIKRRALEIQNTWSPLEERSRRLGPGVDESIVFDAVARLNSVRRGAERRLI